MGSKYMNKDLSSFIKKNYPDNKADLYAAFMESAMQKVHNNGFVGMLTPYVWMFIKSFEQLREFIITNKNISSLIQLEYNSFPEATVPVCCFVIRNYSTDLNGEFIKLSSFLEVIYKKVKCYQLFLILMLIIDLEHLIKLLKILRESNCILDR